MPAVLRYVPQEDIEYWWPLLAPLLRRAVERVESDLSIEEIQERACAGTLRLWLAENDGRVCMAAASGEIRIGTETVTHIFALGGDDMDEWLGPCLTEFERLARLNGITRVRLNGRPGWSRVMPEYRVASVILEKRIDGRYNYN